MNSKILQFIHWFLPPGLVLGHTKFTLPGFEKPFKSVVCRYTPTPEEVQLELKHSLAFWGLTPSDVQTYEFVFNYGPSMCGDQMANGCTHPPLRVTVALRTSGRTPWQRILLHEIAHVALIAKGTDGDPEHKLNEVWDRIKQ
jgi:hypothetical protein